MFNDEDSKLIAKYLSGDENSLEILIGRYLKPIYAFTFRRIGDSGEAEDVTQEIFLKMWRNIHKFDIDKKFKSWIFTIAKNTIIDYYRDRRDLPFSMFENEDGESEFDRLVDEAAFSIRGLESVEADQAVRSAIQTLPDKYRQVVKLKYKEQLTFHEISSNLGQSLNTVKSQYRRALILLKKIMRENN